MDHRIPIRRWKVTTAWLPRNLRKNPTYLAVTLLLTTFAAVVIRTAWICDDAYITFRTVDNFVHGFGLRWNVAERVQVYTHPLWMLLLASASAVTRDLYYTSIALSITASVAAAVLFARRIAADAAMAAAGLMAFTLSKAFVEYSTSGLETPLSYLLLVWFFTLYWADARSPRPRVGVLSLAAALTLVNRLDLGVLIGPALAAAVWRRGVKASAGPVLVGMLPLIAWELFAFVYYGSPIPNTAYAKLGGHIDPSERWAQGAYYFLDSMVRDPLTPMAIAAGLLAPAIARSVEDLPVAVGIALTLAYVTAIGGDFMSGRAYATPFLCGVMVLTRRRWAGVPMPAVAVVISLVAIVGLSARGHPLVSGPTFHHDYADRSGIVDERRVYFPWTALVNQSRDGLQRANGLTRTYWPQYAALLAQQPARAAASHVWALQGAEARARGVRVLSTRADGFMGLAAGPGVHLVDEFGLADAFLARLPAEPGWYAGHLHRRVPTGYLGSLESEANLIQEPPLAEFWDRVRFVTRGPLLSLPRLVTAWNLLIGRYDHLVDESSYGSVHVRLDAMTTRFAEQARIDPRRMIRLREGGVIVDLGGPVRARQLEVSLDGNGDYVVLYQRGRRVVERQRIRAQWPNTNGSVGLATYTLSPPAAPFDSLLVTGDCGGYDGYWLGHARVLR